MTFSAQMAVCQAIFFRYDFAMTIHTIWFSIQLHPTGSCQMKSTRIPGTERTFTPAEEAVEDLIKHNADSFSSVTS